MKNRAMDELCTAWSEADARKSMSKRELREILGLTRNLLEQQKLRSQFPVLYLYCDWAAHPEIDRNVTARDVLDRISQSFVGAWAGGSDWSAAKDPHSHFAAAVRGGIAQSR